MPTHAEHAAAHTEPQYADAEADAPRIIDKLAWIRILDGRLLVTRSTGQDAFYLPGGKREDGESDAQALEREIREELGVELDPSRARHVLTQESPAHGKPGVLVRLTCYEAPAEGTPTPSAEIEEIAWVTPADHRELSAAAQAVVMDLAEQGLLRDRTPEPKALVFDLDDTLLITRQAKWDQSKFVASRFYGFELTDAELEAAWGKPFETMIAEQYRNSASLAEMIEANDSAEADFPKRALPGAAETVAELRRRGYVLGVVTSTRTDFAHRQLRELGYPLEAFEFVHGPEASAHHKPDARVMDPALHHLAGLGIAPVETLYIGDSALDRIAALGAGLDFVAVESGLARDAVGPEHRTALLADVTELPAHLERRRA